MGQACLGMMPNSNAFGMFERLKFSLPVVGVNYPQRVMGQDPVFYHKCGHRGLGIFGEKHVVTDTQSYDNIELNSFFI